MSPVPLFWHLLGLSVLCLLADDSSWHGCSKDLHLSLPPALPCAALAHAETECLTHARAGPWVLAWPVGSMDYKISQVGKGLGVSFGTNSLIRSDLLQKFCN